MEQSPRVDVIDKIVHETNFSSLNDKKMQWVILNFVSSTTLADGHLLNMWKF